MKTVKIGDKFRLLGMEWMVSGVGRDFFQAEIGSRNINLFVSLDADSLDWINEPATISKEARDEVVEWMEDNKRLLVIEETQCGKHVVNIDGLTTKLASMVRDGE